MQITTTQQKQPIEVFSNGDVILHRLVESKIDKDALTAQTTTLYIYDQVKFNVPYTGTLAQEITANFDRWFKYGELDNKTALERQTRQSQARVLVKDGEQPLVNAELAYKTGASTDALVELYMTIIDLQTQIETLKGLIK